MHNKKWMLPLLVLPIIALAVRLQAAAEVYMLDSGDVQLVQRAGKSPQTLRTVVGGRSTKCTLVTVVSPYCAVCARMRGTWAITTARWAADSKASLSVVWLTTTTLEEGEAFVRGTNAEGIALLALRENSPHGFKALQVRGTPTTILFDSGGSELTRVLGEVVPDTETLQRKCNAER